MLDPEPQLSLDSTQMISLVEIVLMVLEVGLYIYDWVQAFRRWSAKRAEKQATRNRGLP